MMSSTRKNNQASEEQGADKETHYQKCATKRRKVRERLPKQQQAEFIYQERY